MRAASPLPMAEPPRSRTAASRHAAARAGVTGLLVLLTASPALAQDDRELLVRHRPILRLDRSERSLPVAVTAMTSRYVAGDDTAKTSRLVDAEGKLLSTANPRVGRPRLTPGVLGRRYAFPGGARASPEDRLVSLGRPLERGRKGRRAPVVYARAATGGDGRSWLQYWVFYEDNAQDRGIARTGRHAGDWELVQLRLDAAGRPERATAAQHSWAESCAWKALRRRGDAPVFFVAHASHATYTRPGDVGRPFPDPTDETDGRGRRLRPPVEVITEETPRWIRWPGRWGESLAGGVPGEQSSPRGPAFQGRAWTDPSAFDRGARDCGEGAPQRRWQWPLVLAPLLGSVLLVVRGRRRRQSFR